jgi:ferredoxin
VTGPYETEHEARTSPEVRAVWASWYANPGAGKMEPHNLAMLTAACSAAGVELGAYDLRILGWLAGWEAQTCAVIAGIIKRAAGTTDPDDPAVMSNPERCRRCGACRSACQCPRSGQPMAESAQVISLDERRRAAM